MSIASYSHSYRAHVESLWFIGRASECGIRRSEVRFQKGTQNFFFVPRSRQDEKHLSQNFLSLLIIIIIIIIMIIIIIIIIIMTFWITQLLVEPVVLLVVH